MGRSYILLIGPVGFAPTMACSMEMVCFTMIEWLIQCGAGEVLLAPIFYSPVSINRISRSDGGKFTSLMSYFQQSMACGDDIRRSLWLSWCLAVITDDLKVIEFFFQKKQLLVIK